MTDAPAPENLPVRRQGLDRRTVLKAGAWAAPVIVLASATPAAAASLECDPNAPSPAVAALSYAVSGSPILAEERGATGWTGTGAGAGAVATEGFHWGSPPTGSGFLSEGDTAATAEGDAPTVVSVSYSFEVQQGGIYSVEASVNAAFGGSGDNSARQFLTLSVSGAGANATQQYTVGDRPDSWWAVGTDPSEPALASDATLASAGYTLIAHQSSAPFSTTFTAVESSTVNVTYSFMLPPRWLGFNPGNVTADNDDFWVTTPTVQFAGCAV